MLDTSIIEDWLLAKLGKSVDVIIAGRVFGGRRGESLQEPKRHEVRDGKLLIYFGSTETLVVDAPDCVRVNEDEELIIPHAEGVVWGWHYYGRKQVPENWCTQEYRMEPDGIVRLAVRGPIAQHIPPHQTFTYAGEELVKLS